MKTDLLPLYAFGGTIVLLLGGVFLLYLRYVGIRVSEKIFKRFELILLSSSILVISITALFDINYLQYKSAVDYRDIKSISLNDFRGFRRPAQTLHGETKFAFISTSIKVKQGRDEINVNSFFHPCRSYVYNRKLLSESLLTHEMYHFHITEYAARTLRRSIHQSLQNGKSLDIKELIRKTNEFAIEMQQNYDSETYHSYVRLKQREWENKIDSLLYELREYENPIIKLNKN
jgi:hypothetical protein